MVYFYFGDDTYRARQTVLALKRKFIELYDTSGRNTETLDADEFMLEKFFTSVKAAGFLAPKKFIIIKNLFSHKHLTDVQDPVIEYLRKLKNTKDENYLVFWQDGVPKQTTKLFKFLKKITEPAKCYRNFEPLTGTALISWMQSEAKTLGKELTRDAAQTLHEMIGDNTWHLHHEIRKLCHFTDKKTVTETDIRGLITAVHGESIFSLVDALGSKQRAEAMRLLDDYLRRDEDLGFLIAMIVRQFRLMLYTKESASKTSDPSLLARELKLHPFVAKKMLAQSKNFTRLELSRVYGDLVSLDAILKSDPEKLRVALTLFVTRL